MMNIRNTINGKIGELGISNRLGLSSLFGYKGKILKNVYIPKDDGTTTEVDLLFITQKGIFVIESKNYIGYIFGSEKQYKWTVTLYAGKDFIGRKRVEKHQFLNPIIQNKGHIKWLQNYLRRNIPMFSCIVFADCGDLKSIELDENSDVIVCYRTQINKSIRRIWSRHEDVLSEEQIDDLYNELKPLTEANKAIKTQHIKDIKEYKQALVCPKCGSELVVRTASRGNNAGKQFYGCSNYPKCKFTRNID